MRIVFFGAGAFGLPALDALSKGAHEILAVVTQPDRPSGRKLLPRPSEAKGWARARCLNVLEYPAGPPGACLEGLRRLDPDLFVVISFGRLLKNDALSIPKRAALNVHASLLPRWRGASPMQSAILAGDGQTGVSVMRMVEALDAGDVLLSRNISMRPDETFLTLQAKLASLGAQALLESLALLEEGRERWTPQEPSAVTTCSKIKKEDGRLKWAEPAQTLDRKVRAFLAWPGAFFFAGKKRVLVKKSRVEAPFTGEAGRVLKTGDDGIWVATSHGALVLEQLQLEGRGVLPAADFLRGFWLKPGDFLL